MQVEKKCVKKRSIIENKHFLYLKRQPREFWVCPKKSFPLFLVYLHFPILPFANRKKIQFFQFKKIKKLELENTSWKYFLLKYVNIFFWSEVWKWTYFQLSPVSSMMPWFRRKCCNSSANELANMIRKKIFLVALIMIVKTENLNIIILL